MAYCCRACPPVRTMLPVRRYSQAQEAPAGLRFIPKFMPPKDYAKIVQDAFQMHAFIVEEAKGKAKIGARTYLSQQHNLKSDEHYKVLKIDQRDCQHFERYGENGHTLTYFIGNKNIPSCVEGLKEKIANLEEVRARFAKNMRLTWNMTFNTYGSVNRVRSGFPFHVDIPSNGAITSIFTLLSDAELQMKRFHDANPTFSVTLEPNSLLLLSGDSRWKWQHRILSSPLQSSMLKIERMSVVLGCRQYIPTPEEIANSPELQRELAEQYEATDRDPETAENLKLSMAMLKQSANKKIV